MLIYGHRLQKLMYTTRCIYKELIYAIGPLSVCPVLSVCLSAALVYCGQTAKSMKIKLGIEVGLGPGHIV